MSFALAADDKVIVVVEVDPNTLFAVDGNVIVLPPVASCVTTNVPYDPAMSEPEKFNVLLPPSVTLAFKPSAGFHVMVDPSVNVCGVDA
jgi:hypothetical protein